MINKIKIDGYKSFKGFEVFFRPLTVVAGPNGTGKSNLFDALNLLSSCASGKTIDESLSAARGGYDKQFLLMGENSMSSSIRFEIEMTVPSVITDRWGQTQTLTHTHFTYVLELQRSVEQPLHTEIRREELLAKGADNPYICSYHSDETGALCCSFAETGAPKFLAYPKMKSTMLSMHDTIEFAHILAVKMEMMHWNFFQLNPEMMRVPSDISGSSLLSFDGMNLAGAMMHLKQKDPLAMHSISTKMAVFVPGFVSVDVHLDEVRNKYVVFMTDKDGRSFEASSLSDGTLRFLTLCVLSETNKDSGVLCLEEPENGMNPMRIEQLAEVFETLTYLPDESQNTSLQILVNSHSPKLASIICKNTGSSSIVFISRSVTSIYIDDLQNRYKLHVTRMSPLGCNSRNPISTEYSRAELLQAEREFSNYTK